MVGDCDKFVDDRNSVVNTLFVSSVKSGIVHFGRECWKLPNTKHDLLAGSDLRHFVPDIDVSLWSKPVPAVP